MVQKLEQSFENWCEVVKICFPKGAEFNFDSSFTEGLAIYISWELATTARPKKRSKIVKLIFSREFLEDYQEMPEAKQNKEKKRVQFVISGKMKSFDPYHNFPIHIPSPIVEWIITT